MKIISFASNKGGVGKTTSCVNLAAALAAKNLSVLIVDFDAQGGSTHHLSSKFDKFSATLYEFMSGKCFIKNCLHEYNKKISIVPINKNFAKLSFENFSKNVPVFISAIPQIYDFVFFDLAPAIFPGAILPLEYSDYAIIPCNVQGGLSLLGVESQAQIISDLQEQSKKIKILGILPTFCDNTKLAKETLVFLQDECNDFVLSSRIRKNTNLAQAASVGKTVFEFKKNSRGATDYKKFADEFLERINNARSV